MSTPRVRPSTGHWSTRTIPDAAPAQDNETGTRMALADLARLVEAYT